MKKSKAETAKTRQRIIEAASHTIREKGIEATGVAEVMAEAGLSHGGFYRHFASKEELVAAAIAMSRKDFVAGTVAAAEEGAGAILKHFQDYVTPAHRDDVGSGCPLAACGSEIVRGDAKTRRLATTGFWTMVEKSAPFMRAPEGEDPTETAIGVVTNMIGALTMARMVDDPEVSDRILAAARNRIARAMGVAPNKSKARPAKAASVA